ncbi:hypothetical protein ACLKA6_013961 [Drosophila palustris]
MSTGDGAAIGAATVAKSLAHLHDVRSQKSYWSKKNEEIHVQAAGAARAAAEQRMELLQLLLVVVSIAPTTTTATLATTRTTTTFRRARRHTANLPGLIKDQTESGRKGKGKGEGEVLQEAARGGATTTRSGSVGGV